jgi:hypothetical protein
MGRISGYDEESEAQQMKIYEAGVTEITYPFATLWIGDRVEAESSREAEELFAKQGYHRNLVVRQVGQVQYYHPWAFIAQRGNMKTEAQTLLHTHLAELGIETEPELQFYAKRRWRMDLGCERLRLGFEIEGGAFSRGRHVRGQGFVNDLEKYNVATALGYRLFRFTPQQVLSGQAREFVKDWIAPVRRRP